MKITTVGNQTCELLVTREEIRILHQALNEICNGVTFGDSEFKTRMGTDRKTAVALMAQLGGAYDPLEKQ
jgi:hypothetical protein